MKAAPRAGRLRAARRAAAARRWPRSTACASAAAPSWRWPAATASPPTREDVIGLPEVRLGILPGFGGTTRLPRLDRPARGARPDPHRQDARRAARAQARPGRRVLPRRTSSPRAVALAGRAARSAYAFARTRRERSAPPRGPARVGARGQPARPRDRARAGAQERDEARRTGHYPAPLAVLEILPRVARGPIPEALALEARAVGELLVAPEYKNLIAIFFLSERAKKDPPTPRRDRRSRAAACSAPASWAAASPRCSPTRASTCGSRTSRPSAVGADSRRRTTRFDEARAPPAHDARASATRAWRASPAHDYAGFGRPTS